MSAVRVGLIGCGFAVNELKGPAYAASQQFEVSAIADPSPAARGDAANQFGLEPQDLYADHRELLARSDIDVVDVSTPHATHFDIVMDVIAAGKSLLCDKPPAMSLAEADMMIGAAERAGVTCGVYHNFRHFPSQAALRGVVTDGRIGTPRLATLAAHGIYAPDVDPTQSTGSSWRVNSAVSGGGILIDYGMHQIYLAMDLLGVTEFDSVSATISRSLVHGDVEDRAHLELHAGEAQASIALSWGSGTTGFTSVQGDQGTATLLYAGGNSAQHNVSRGVSVLAGRANDEIIDVTWPRLPLTWYYGGALDAFHRTLNGEADPGADLLAARTVLGVALGAYKSAALGAPVALPLLASDPVYQHGIAGLRMLDLPTDSPILRQSLFERAKPLTSAL